MQIFSDEFFMKQAYQEALKALDRGEVPIGAVVVSNKKIIAKAHNLTETLQDITAHAEMQAITSAANHIGGKYLHDCILYVTLEPCLMCAGALYWSQISTIVYGTSDMKNGYSRENSNVLHPKTKVIKNILEKECSQLLKEFFKSKR